MGFGITAGFSNASFESPGLRTGTRPISGRSLCGKKSRSWRRKAVVTRASPRSCRCRMPSEVCKCEEVESGLGQTKPLKLQRPFGRRITQGGDADAARKPPFDGGLDQSRRDECHRYRHVDVTNAALLARGNAFDAGSATDDLVEPGTSARDRFDKRGTSLRLHWSRARSCGRGWKQDLLEPLGRRLRPGDQQRGVFFDRGRWSCGLVCALLTGVHQPKRQMAVADFDASDHGSNAWLVC